MGNVDWRVMLAIGLPGAVGAFHRRGRCSRTWRPTQPGCGWRCSCSASGLLIIARFGFGKNLLPAFSARTRHLWPVGLVGGLVDATGGGGWGPVRSRPR